jgi:hypothetical protein
MILEGFEMPFEREMNKNNRRVKLSECIPWDTLAEAYYQLYDEDGASGQRLPFSHWHRDHQAIID